jgi:hypothetical protein
VAATHDPVAEHEEGVDGVSVVIIGSGSEVS